MNAPRVSVAIPLYDEEPVLSELLRRLRAVLDALPGGPHELVLVDDGSRDRTWALVAEAAAADPRIVAVSLSRNFGHQYALSAAIDHATGDVIVLMDGDLQDAPEEIPRFLAEHARGFDVVYARRVKRKEPWVLRLAYFLFYRLLAALSAVRLPLDAGDFALLSRRAVDQLKALPEHHRYLRGLRSWVGFRQTGLDVERHERHEGESKYGLVRLFGLAFDAIFAFSVVPLRAAAGLGCLTMAGSLAFGLYSLYVYFFTDRSPRGFTALVLVVLFLAGVQLLFLGVIGEYVGRTYEESKGRPHYVVGERIRGGRRET